MRVGRQANSSIGRFLRMYLRNICGYRIAPGDGDKASIGYTFNVAMAEDEAWAHDIGWPTGVARVPIVPAVRPSRW